MSKETESKPKYIIDIPDLGVVYEDAGPWRSYTMVTWGDNYSDLIDNADISEVDQDGGELATYDYGECTGEVALAVERACMHATREMAGVLPIRLKHAILAIGSLNYGAVVWGLEELDLGPFTQDNLDCIKRHLGKLQRISDAMQGES